MIRLSISVGTGKHINIFEILDEVFKFCFSNSRLTNVQF